MPKFGFKKLEKMKNMQSYMKTDLRTMGLEDLGLIRIFLNIFLNFLIFQKLAN